MKYGAWILCQFTTLKRIKLEEHTYYRKIVTYNGFPKGVKKYKKVDAFEIQITLNYIIKLIVLVVWN